MWLRRSQNLSTTSHSGTSVPDILASAGLSLKHDTYDLCFFPISFDGAKFTSVVSGTYCMPFGSHRTLILVALLNYIVDRKPGLLRHGQPFSFFLDATDATRIRPAAFRALGFPVLSASTAATDAFTLPVPDTHMLAGLVNTLPDFKQYAPEALMGFAQGMTGAYDHSIRAPPWEQRKRKAIYSGGCHATLKTDVDILPIRAEVCAAFPHGNHSLLTVVIHSDMKSPVGDGILGRMNRKCRLCPSTGKLTKEDMLQYRYQVTVDGHGTSWDGTFWKLSSGSPLYWVLSDPSINEPYWQPFYLPVLHPHQHYIPVHLSQLEAALRAVVDGQGDDEALREMGDTTAAHMRCHVTPQYVVRYVELLMQYLQHLAART